MAEERPEWLPYRVYVASYHSDSEGGLNSRKIVEEFKNKYILNPKGLDGFEFKSGSISNYLRVIKEGNSECYLLVAGSKKMEKSRLTPNLPSKYDLEVGNLVEVLPKNLDANFLLRFTYTSSKNEAEDLLRRIIIDSGMNLQSAGHIKNCLLASFRDEIKSTLPATTKLFIIIPYGQYSKTLTDSVWRLCIEICSLAIYTGEMSHLYSERRLMFDQMEASENSTQIRINEILASMRKPVDEIQSSHLEEILKEITIQFSRLSTLSNTMRRDRVKAQSIMRNTRSLLKKWNEQSFDEAVLNIELETDVFEGMIAPFIDFIERIDALTAQYNTVLDSVRTYLGIRQQNMSISEQVSSRQQLIQLVDLQSTLHKLEILIVAFYLTEMARIVFESLLPEHIEFPSSNLLTAAFIPIALILSMLLSRILHVKH